MKTINRHIPITLPLILCWMGASSGHAAVTYVDPPDIVIPFTFGGVYLDLVTENQSTPGTGAPEITNDSYGISYGEPTGDWDLNIYFGGALMIHNTSLQPYRETPADNQSAVQSVGLPSTIDGVTPTPGGALPGTGGIGMSGTTTGGDLNGNQTPTHMGAGPNQFASGTTGYIAFILDPGPSQLYGWMQVTLEDDGDTGLIHRWAYSPDPLQVGQIPEPSTSMLLCALAAAGTLRRRRS